MTAAALNFISQLFVQQLFCILNFSIMLLHVWIEILGDLLQAARVGRLLTEEADLLFLCELDQLLNCLDRGLLIRFQFYVLFDAFLNLLEIFVKVQFWLLARWHSSCLARDFLFEHSQELLELLCYVGAALLAHLLLNYLLLDGLIHLLVRLQLSILPLCFLIDSTAWWTVRQIGLINLRDAHAGELWIHPQSKLIKLGFELLQLLVLSLLFVQSYLVVPLGRCSKSSSSELRCDGLLLLLILGYSS